RRIYQDTLHKYLQELELKERLIRKQRDETGYRVSYSRVFTDPQFQKSLKLVNQFEAEYAKFRAIEKRRKPPRDPPTVVELFSRMESCLVRMKSEFWTVAILSILRYVVQSAGSVQDNIEGNKHLSTLMDFLVFPLLEQITNDIRSSPITARLLDTIPNSHYDTYHREVDNFSKMVNEYQAFVDSLKVKHMFFEAKRRNKGML
ncbi:MAG: hypothetical protein OK457_11390, partial [Thaumarchaeota archaeon]|nr:hypothetical protein [Nitrososphaerota archaeon]